MADWGSILVLLSIYLRIYLCWHSPQHQHPAVTWQTCFLIGRLSVSRSAKNSERTTLGPRCLRGRRSQLLVGISFHSRAVLIQKNFWWWRVLECIIKYWSGCLRLETCMATRTYVDIVVALLWWHWLNMASLRSERGCKFRLCNRPVALDVRSVRLIPHISLAGLLCAASRWLVVAVLEAESHASEAYSRKGRTSRFYAVDLTCPDVISIIINI